jgi:H+/Cl- antiporter ClcA
MEHLGKTIFFLGILLAILGGILWLLGNKLSWFDNLPGDIKVEKEGFKFYAPIVSMLLVSIFVSLLIWLARKFWQ